LSGVTGIVKAALVPALAAAGLLWLDWTEYVNYLAAVAIILGFGYQVVDSTFLATVANGKTKLAADLWQEMELDEELWSLKGNISVTVLLTFICIWFPAVLPITLFMALAALYAVVRYMGHVSKYDERITSIDDFL
jgi:hypothetical protein